VIVQSAPQQSGANVLWSVPEARLRMKRCSRDGPFIAHRYSAPADTASTRMTCGSYKKEKLLTGRLV
jgi:hypothetical protein